MTAFATSEIFKIFFKMMFSIILLGLIHGLVILPVYLASKICMFLLVKMYITFAFFHVISFHSPNEMIELLVVIFYNFILLIESKSQNYDEY